MILSEDDTFSVDEAWPKQKTPQFSDSPTALNKVLLRHEKEMIESALAESRGRVSGPRGAAAKLRIATGTLDSTITRLGINKFRSEKPQAKLNYSHTAVARKLIPKILTNQEFLMGQEKCLPKPPVFKSVKDGPSLAT